MTTEAEPGTIPAAEDNKPRDAHVVCGRCYPNPNFLGVPAICGEKLLGINPPPDATLCQQCKDQRWHHAMTHRFGERG